MYKNQIGLKIFSLIIEKILKIYNECSKIIVINDSNQETEQYNFDFF
jgi:hypothetical protein